MLDSSLLKDAFAQPGVSTGHNRIAIDRRTIEKTWKYMDKVRTNINRHLSRVATSGFRMRFPHAFSALRCVFEVITFFP